MITGTCAACGRKGHRYGTTHGPDAPDRWDPIACINGLRDEVAQLRDALQRIATYEIPGTGVYRNTDAAEYARRVLGSEHDHMDGIDSKDLADPDKVWRCDVCSDRDDVAFCQACMRGYES